MQAVAAELSGYAGKDAQRLFQRSFLTRNELVDSQNRVIFAG